MSQRHLAPLTAVAIYGLVGMALWVRPEWRAEWDSALYLLLGRSLALGEGYVYLGEPYVKSPPGLPWLISLALPDGVFRPELLHRWIMAFATAGVAAAGFALSRVASARTAWVAALLAGTSALWIGRLNWVQSEFPFIALVFLALGLGSVAFRRGGAVPWAAAAGAALALAAAFHFRSIAVLAFPALLFEGLRGRPRVALPVVGVATLLCLPWIHHAATAGAAGPGDQLLVADYLSATLRVDPGDPGSAWVSAAGWLERMGNNGAALLRWMAWTVSGTASPWVGAVAVLWVAAGLARIRLRGVAALDVFFGLYVLLLATYFAHAPRLLTPLLPILYLYMLDALEWLDPALERLRRPGFSRALRSAPLAWLAAVNLYLLPHSLGGYFWTGVEERTRDLERVAAWIREETPPDAVVLCANAPVLSLLGERRAYTHRFRPGPALLRRTEPDYVIFDGRRSPEPFRALVGLRGRERVVLPSDRSRKGIAVYEMGGPAGGR